MLFARPHAVPVAGATAAATAAAAPTRWVGAMRNESATRAPQRGLLEIVEVPEMDRAVLLSAPEDAVVVVAVRVVVHHGTPGRPVAVYGVGDFHRESRRGVRT